MTAPRPEIWPVSGSEWTQKARELRAFPCIQAKFSGETGLGGCAGSLERTRLWTKFPVKQGIYRELRRY
jgi:hypothetical protein